MVGNRSRAIMEAAPARQSNMEAPIMLLRQVFLSDSGASPTDPLPHFLSHLECPFTPVLLLFRREATSTDYFVRPPHPPDMTNLLDERTYIFPRSTFLMELFSNILFPSL